MLIVKLELYHTEACHLCELAGAVVQNVLGNTELVDGLSFEFEQIDIANNPDLFEIYGTRIPVVKLADQQDDLGWPFDEVQLIEYLNLNLQKIIGRG